MGRPVHRIDAAGRRKVPQPGFAGFRDDMVWFEISLAPVEFYSLQFYFDA
jgi:hypothetical protein